MMIETLKSICSQEDVELLGILELKEDPRFLYFQKWIQEKKHGEMSFLERYSALRHNPALLEKNMTTALICAYPYGEKSSHLKQQTSQPRIARYAQLKDYHKQLRRIGSRIMSSFLTRIDQSHCSYRVLVDSAPVLEKSLAEQTGAGFIGKNTLFIQPKKGSLLFLFEILTSAHLPLYHQTPRWPMKNPCGSCRRCQVHCPTGALNSDYVLDATRCLAYYTIEHRSVIPIKYWPYLADHFFGCDVCQMVCPHNRYAKASHQIKTHLRTPPPLEKIALMDQTQYEKFFGGTPMTRAKRIGLRRNALIAMCVKHHPKLPQTIRVIKKENLPLLMETLNQKEAYERSLKKTPEGKLPV